MMPSIWDIILLHSQPSAGVSAANITSQPDMSVSKTSRWVTVYTERQFTNKLNPESFKSAPFGL